LAGHQSAARRGADRAAGVILREAHALGGQTVNVRRLEFPLPVTAQIAVPQVVGLDEDDVGSGLRRKGRRKCDENNAGADVCSSSHSGSMSQNGDRTRMTRIAVDWRG